jgi:hypothetical protein
LQEFCPDFYLFLIHFEARTELKKIKSSTYLNVLNFAQGLTALHSNGDVVAISVHCCSELVSRRKKQRVDDGVWQINSGRCQLKFIKEENVIKINGGVLFCCCCC